jgi:4,5-dihydroxyphthalate decarboxylase
MAPLTIGLFDYMHTAPLKRGEVKVDGFDLEFVQHGKKRAGDLFRHEVGELDLDICEMGITTAIAAKSYGVPLTPIPIFTVRRFDYNLMFVNTKSGVRDPADLAGKTIAVRSPNVTIDLLCSAMLSDVYGVDLRSIHWIANGDNHIAAATLPENIELRPDADLEKIVESGEAVATFGGYKGNSPDIKPLISDLPALYDTCLERFGCTTIHHTIVVKDETLENNPGLVDALVDAFTKAKQPFLDRLQSGEDLMDEMKSVTSFGPGHDYGISKMSEIRLPDPSPYGLGINTPMLNSLFNAAFEQNYLSRIWTVDEVFAS